MIAAHSRDEDVIQSVVVVISDRRTHSVETHVESGTYSGVSEMAFAVVVIQSGGGWIFTCGHVPGPVGGIDEQQIGRAVVVEVEKSHPPAHGLRQEFVAISAVVVEEADAGFPGDVSE